MDEQCKENEFAGCSATNEELGRSSRTKRKQVEPIYCPVCSITVRTSEIDSHLLTEIEKLCKLSCSKQKANGRNSNSSTSSTNGEENANEPWETYLKVKSNRNSRQKMKSRKRKHDEAVCPICNKEITNDINFHVDLCLRRSESNGGDSDENIDVEGGYDEYEWAGQSRVRATSLLQGGLSTLGTSISMTNEDEDLVVDGDDSNVFGVAQYSEHDIIVPSDDKENEALRKAVIGANSSVNQSATSEKEVNVTVNGDPILEALKSRIRELERYELTKDDVHKCLICMERYKTPVISICCWHVHCEQCWLHTLGAKKLCPQCNMITSPSDLRRIYI